MKLVTALLAPFALNTKMSGRCSTRFLHSVASRRSISRLHSSMSSPTAEARIVHCNHAGASPSPTSVVDTVLQHMQIEQTLGGYTAGDMASQEMETVYERVAQLLHLKEDSNPRLEIALVESATVAWTRLFYAMVSFQNKQKRKQQQSSPGQPLVILVSEAEYAANVVAACQWAKDHADTWTVLAIPSSSTAGEGGSNKSTGMVDLGILRQMLDGNYKYSLNNSKPGQTITLDPANIAMVCVTHIPTNSGIVNDVEGIGELIAQHNNNKPNDMPSMLYLVDACQSIGQREVDVHQIQCHGLVATGRKFLRGPRGTGFLYVPHQIANGLMPHHVDHNGVPVVAVPPFYRQDKNDNVPVSVESLLEIKPKDGAARFEFWESNFANKLGLGEAIRHALDENDAGGMAKIQSKVSSLAQDLYQRLEQLDDNLQIQVYHPPMSGIVTFHVPTVPSALIKQRLWEGEDLKFETSLVPATSTPLDSSKTQVPDLVRVSLSYTNTVEDIDAVCERLEKVMQQELC